MKLKCDKPLSNFAFNFNLLRPYSKDKKTYGGMFASNEGLYSKREQDEMMKAPPKKVDENVTNDFSDAELRARAKNMGIDLVRTKEREKTSHRHFNSSRKNTCTKYFAIATDNLFFMCHRTTRKSARK